MSGTVISPVAAAELSSATQSDASDKNALIIKNKTYINSIVRRIGSFKNSLTTPESKN